MSSASIRQHINQLHQTIPFRPTCSLWLTLHFQLMVSASQSELTAAKTHPPAHAKPLIGLDSIDGGALGFLIFRFAGSAALKPKRLCQGSRRLLLHLPRGGGQLFAVVCLLPLEPVGLEGKVFLSSNRRCWCWTLGLLAPLHNTRAPG